MTLKPGTQLGSYEILSLIGSGGMGEVYRARDTKLEREVAIKVLPEDFAHDPVRLARFRREAQLLASLNHPNIAAIYGLEDSGSIHFLVLELVPGETLAEGLRRGPLEPEDALKIAAQISEALEAAHEKTIIHRDLKPANVKLTPEGKAKVLDFGLAKAYAQQDDALDPSNIPTASLGATRPGVILGTAAYMSPEQARGKPVDRRTDIWAFGCVLYELLTAQQAFPGDTVTEILAAILKSEPDWQALPNTTSAAVRTLLRRCLQKDPKRRLRDAADIRIEIEEILTAPVAEKPLAMVRPRRWMLVSGLACLLVAAIASIATWSLKPAPPQTAQAVARFVMTLPPNERLAGLDYLPAMAFSPDGNQLAYVAGRGGGQQLYLRSLDSLEAKPLAGTEGAFGPFFSPDGQWIGFFAEGNLKKVSVTGGAPVTLASSSRTNSRGGTWGSDGRIIFAPGATTGLSRVSASGDTPEVLTTLDTKKGEGSHRFPQLLPGGKAVLFTIGTGGSWDAAQIVAQRLDSGERTVLIQGGSDGRYLPSGHLVYVRAATLMAVPFDPERLEVKGSPVPLIEGVLQGTENSGAMHASVSSSGWLVYAAGGNRLERTVVWVDRKGAEQPLAAPPRPYVAPRLSPDGQLVLEGIDQGNKTDIWLYTIARGTLTRLTFEATNNNPVWAPDGKRIAFSSSKAGAVNLFWKLADGSGPEERLTSSENTQNSTSWSPDGQFIAFTEIDRKSRGDVWVLPLQGDRKPIPVARTSFGESAAAFSPDGLRLAYVSDESGRQEVYVQLFPGLGGKLQISTDGGTEPVWSRDGKELFYRNGDAMMAVPIAMRPTFTPGKPGTLFEKPYRRSGATPNYDVSPDGQRFLMVKDSEQATAVTQITVVLNWFEELKRKVPGKQ